MSGNMSLGRRVVEKLNSISIPLKGSGYHLECCGEMPTTYQQTSFVSSQAARR
jgi:hypothetical protein